MESYSGKKFKDFTSLFVGGEIKEVIYPQNKEELKEFLKKNNNKYIVLGKGTNVLASEKFYDGTVIKMDKMKKKMLKYNNEFTFSSNISSNELFNFVSKHNLGGAEFISTIPGEVGGLVCMNAGCYNQEIKDYFVKGLFLDKEGNEIILTKEDMEFSYRNSKVRTDNLICLEVTFLFEEEFDFEKRKKYLKSRIANQPRGKNAGSVFKNNETIPTWKLIDALDLRGYEIGGAKVSDKHTNFIENFSNATANDVYNLMCYVKRNTFDKFGIILESEWTIINF